MLGVEKILVDIDSQENAVYLLEKARDLALKANAKVEVIRVIYEGFADLDLHSAEEKHQLKTFVMQAEEDWLEEVVNPIRQSVKTVESATIWNKDSWQGIVDAAHESDADLIVKAANVEQGLGTVVHTPEDWNLLRHSDIPVMLVKPSAWVENPIVVAAVDGLAEEQAALNKKILLEAAHLTQILGGELYIIASYPFSEPWMGPVALAVDFDRVKKDVEQFIRDNINRWLDETGVTCKFLSIEEGKPAHVISHYLESCSAEMLVMGTVARSGVKGIVLGNTSETILHRSTCDVVVLK